MDSPWWFYQEFGTSDPLESALRHASLLASPAWNSGWTGDQYHKKIQEIWVKHNRLQEASRAPSVCDLLAGIADGMPRTVRNVIPFSRLAMYGDIEYNAGDVKCCSNGCRDVPTKFKTYTHSHRQEGAGGNWWDVECFAASVETMFVRLQKGPYNVEDTIDEEQTAGSFNLSMVERSMVNGWTTFDQTSPSEDWLSQLVSDPKPPLIPHQRRMVCSAAYRENSVAWANVLIETYPKLLDTLRSTRPTFRRMLTRDLPLAIEFEEILWECISPIEAYALCPPGQQSRPPTALNLLSNAILWDKVSAQSVKDIWLRTCADGGSLLKSVFPELGAILQHTRITPSTAYLVDKALMRYRLELGFQGLQIVTNSDKGVPNNYGSMLGSRNNQTTQGREKRNPQTLKNQGMFPYLNPGVQQQGSTTYSQINNWQGYRLPWNVVAQLPNPRQMNSLPNQTQSQPHGRPSGYFKQVDRKQFYQNARATKSSIEILTRPTGQTITAAQLDVAATPPFVENPIPVQISCNSKWKKQPKRESTLKVLTQNREHQPLKDASERNKSMESKTAFSSRTLDAEKRDTPVAVNGREPNDVDPSRDDTHVFGHEKEDGGQSSLRDFYSLLQHSLKELFASNKRDSVLKADHHSRRKSGRFRTAHTGVQNKWHSQAYKARIKKRDKRNNRLLLDEQHQIEKCKIFDGERVPSSEIPRQSNVSFSSFDTSPFWQQSTLGCWASSPYHSGECPPLDLDILDDSDSDDASHHLRGKEISMFTSINIDGFQEDSV